MVHIVTIYCERRTAHKRSASLILPPPPRKYILMLWNLCSNYLYHAVLRWEQHQEFALTSVTQLLSSTDKTPSPLLSQATKLVFRKE